MRTSLLRIVPLVLALSVSVDCARRDPSTPGLTTQSNETVPARPALATTAAPPVGSSASGGCRPRFAEKLGLPFVFVCGMPENAASNRSADGRPAGFWISATPLPCTPGAHETLGCPAVTPLLDPARGNANDAITPIRAVMADSFSAHRLCALRMAGRLPTASERAHARRALGLGALMVTESADSPQRFRYTELPEWVSDTPCDDPSDPTERCHFSEFAPTIPAYPIPWTSIRPCTATRLRPSQTIGAVEPGFGCSAPNFAWASLAAGAAATSQLQSLPCAAQIHGAGAWSLDCAAWTEDTSHPEGDDSPVSAFRCVVPEWALASFDDATNRPR